jgi:hypothetical protein
VREEKMGYIYVANSSHVYTSNEQGQIKLQVDTFPVQASVWHSLQTAPLDNKKQFGIESTNPLSITINTSTPAPRNTFGSKFRKGNGQ